MLVADSWNKRWVLCGCQKVSSNNSHFPFIGVVYVTVTMRAKVKATGWRSWISWVTESHTSTLLLPKVAEPITCPFLLFCLLSEWLFECVLRARSVSVVLNLRRAVTWVCEMHLLHFWGGWEMKALLTSVSSRSDCTIIIIFAPSMKMTANCSFHLWQSSLSLGGGLNHHSAILNEGSSLWSYRPSCVTVCFYLSCPWIVKHF